MHTRKQHVIIAVIGSRTPNKDSNDRVRSLVGPRIKNQTDSVFISGGCPTGADHWCRFFCELWGLKYMEVPAFWGGPLGKGAGPARNRLIVDMCTKLLAFWDGKSPGTKGTIEYAKSCGVPMEVIDV